MVCGGSGDLLSRLISETAPFGLILAAAEDVPDEALPTEEGLRSGGQAGAGRAVGEGSEGCLDQREAPTNPVAIAPVDKLVRATGEAALWGVLAGGEPVDQAWYVEAPILMSETL